MDEGNDERKMWLNNGKKIEKLVIFLGVYLWFKALK